MLCFLCFFSDKRKKVSLSLPAFTAFIGLIERLSSLSRFARILCGRGDSCFFSICVQKTHTDMERLSEFSSTPSGNLTVDEFQTLWLEEERDPPAFTRARETKKQHQSANTLQSADKSAQEMATQHQDSSSSSCLPSLVSESLLPLTEEDDATLNNPQDQDQDDMDQDDDIMAGEQIDDNIDDQDSQQVMQEMLDILQSEEGARLEKAFNSLGSRTTRKADDGEEEGGETLSDLDDDREVQNMLAVSTEEVEFKTLLWTSENQEWMDSQEAKRQQRSEKDLLPKSASQSSKQRKRPKKPSHRALPYATSAAEAARNLIDSKPALSRKINYTVLDNLVRLFCVCLWCLCVISCCFNEQFDESVASTTPSQLPLSAMD